MHNQNVSQKNNQYQLANYFTAFLPKDYPDLLKQYQFASYNQLMDHIRSVQQKEEYGHMNSNDLSSAQLSFLFSRILFYRQEYDNAISILYSLNHIISEHYLDPSSSSHDIYQQTEHNINLTNSLLEMTHLYGVTGDQTSQREYLNLAEEQQIDFLGTNEQRFEIALKFLQSYRDLNETVKLKEQEEKILSLIDHVDYPLNKYQVYKNLLTYFKESHQKQAIYQLGLKIIQQYNIYSDMKEELQGEIIPMISEELAHNTNEGKIIREHIKGLKLELRDSLSSRRQIQELITQISKLKYENKIDDGLKLSHELLEKIMNDLPNNIPSDLLLIAFNNLFVLYALKNNFEMASEFGEKWVKLAEKLKIPSQIIQSRSNIATYYLKGKRLESAQNHIDATLSTLIQNPSCIDTIDTFIVECLHFQISYLNKKISQDQAQESLKNVFKTLDILISQNVSNNLLFNKIIEMYLFLRNNQLKQVLKPLGLSYLSLKSITKDMTFSRIDYIVNQDIGEIEFFEKNYDGSIQFINQSIRVYEQLRVNKDVNNNQQTVKPRQIILAYIKACIEINRGDVDKGFQALQKYPISFDKEDIPSEISQNSSKISQTQQIYYWGSRVQAETFYKLGQFSMAYNFINQGLKYAQTIQDIELLKNTYQFKEEIFKQIPDKSQIIEDNKQQQIQNQSTHHHPQLTHPI